MLHTVPRSAGKCVRLRECGGVGARGIVRAKERAALHKLVRVQACVSARVCACVRARACARRADPGDHGRHVEAAEKKEMQWGQPLSDA